MIQNPKNGMRVQVACLESALGMFVAWRHLSVRRVGVTGTITGCVPGHGGDVWWVQHDGSNDENPQVGAYCVDELAAL